MAQVNISIRADEDLKNDFNKLCEDLGLTMTTAFTSFMKMSLQENAIPFKLERKKSLTSILDSFGTCSKEESKEISERLASLTEDDKKVARIEVIDL
ncbi:MAG: type II toxin-antitoxin system RelB/DinJ family antitoxin [Fusobacterium sp.]